MKPLFAIALCLVATFAHSQEPKILKYRTFATRTVSLDTDGSFIAASDWESEKFLVILKGDPVALTIYSDPIKKYDLTSSISESAIVGDDGSKWWYFQGVDKNGIACVVRMVLLKESKTDHVATCYVDYKNTTYVYRLKDYE